MMINKSWCKIAVWFSYIFNSSDIPLDFQVSIWVVPVNHLMYFLVGINPK